MNANTWLRILHIVGVMLWIGGALSVALVAAAAEGEAKRSLATVSRQVALKVATPGMILAWVGGLVMFGLSLDGYLTQGWMHGKITIGLIVAALTGVLTGRLRKAAAGEDVSPKSLRIFGWVIVVLAVGNVVLALLGPHLMAS
jgi:putative membrane protein